MTLSAPKRPIYKEEVERILVWSLGYYKNHDHVDRYSNNGHVIQILEEDILENYIIKWTSKYGSEYIIPFPYSRELLIEVIRMFEQHTEYFKE